MVSQFSVVTPPFVDQRDGIAKVLVFATRTGQWRALDQATWGDIKRGDLMAVPPLVIQDLSKIELLVPAGEDELATILARNRAAVVDDPLLRVVVQPTALCQMGCDYCGQDHRKHELSALDQERVLSKTRGFLETHRFRVLQVSWFGGEPLLGLNVIRTLAPKTQALAREFHCQYKSTITTNGLALSHDVASELVHDLGVTEFLITLDGPAEFHDARRPTKAGGATFARIFANLVDLCKRDDLDAGIVIRCNVDRRNCQGVSRLIKLLAEAGVLSRIRDFFVAPVHDWGNEAGSLALTKDEFAEHETRWMAELFALGFVTARLIPSRETIRCMAVTPNSFLVDPYGSLFNCTEVSLIPAPPPERVTAAAQKRSTWELPVLSALSTSATYALGDLSSGEKPERRQLLQDFNERVGRGEYPCSTCRMLPVCGGGCPKHWLEGIVPCPSAKFNIENRLLLGYAISRLKRATARTTSDSQEREPVLPNGRS